MKLGAEKEPTQTEIPFAYESPKAFIDSLEDIWIDGGYGAKRRLSGNEKNILCDLYTAATLITDGSRTPEIINRILLEPAMERAREALPAALYEKANQILAHFGLNTIKFGEDI